MPASARQRGFSSLELAVVIAMFCVFAGVLLERMLYYEAYTERVYFDLTVRQMQSALRMRIANLMIAKQPVDYSRIADENPMDWLEKKPAGYVAHLENDEPENLRDGEWAYDRSRHEVLYRPRLDGEFDALLGEQALVRVGLDLRYALEKRPNGLDLKVRPSGQGSRKTP